MQAVEGLYGIESDAFGLAIVFNAPLARVQKTLRDNGFATGANGPAQAGLTEDSAFGRAEVTGDERTSRLVCDWGL